MSTLWDLVKHRVVQYKRDPVTGGISLSAAASTVAANASVNPSGLVDGTDSAAINAALAALSAAGGGILELGAGTFTITTAVAPASKVWLRGKGMGVTVLKLAANRPYTTSAGNVISVLPAGADITNWKLSDFSIDGNKANQSNIGGFTTDNAGNGIRVSGNGAYFSRNFEIVNVESYGNIYHGAIFVAGLRSFRIEGGLYHDNGFRGLHLHGSDGESAYINDFQVLGLRVYSNGTDQTGNTPNGAAALRTGLFVTLSNASRGSIVGNNVFNEPGYGLEIDGYIAPDTAAYAANNFIFSGNTVFDCGIGVSFGNSAKNIAFTGNTVKGCNTVGKGSGATGDGIRFSGAAGGSGISIAGNIVSDNYGWGFVADNGANIWSNYTISCNSFINNSLANTSSFGGVRIAGSTQATVTANTILQVGATTATYSLSVLNSNNITVSANSIDSGATAQAAFFSDPTSSNISVANNVLKRASGNALVIQSSSTSVYGNILSPGNTASITGTAPVGPAFHYGVTGAVTPSMGANAPTGTTTPQAWLPVNVAGTVRYIPAW